MTKYVNVYVNDPIYSPYLQGATSSIRLLGVCPTVKDSMNMYEFPVRLWEIFPHTTVRIV